MINKVKVLYKLNETINLNKSPIDIVDGCLCQTYSATYIKLKLKNLSKEILSECIVEITVIDKDCIVCKKFDVDYLNVLANSNSIFGDEKIITVDSNVEEFTCMVKKAVFQNNIEWCDKIENNSSTISNYESIQVNSNSKNLKIVIVLCIIVLFFIVLLFTLLPYSWKETKNGWEYSKMNLIKAKGFKEINGKTYYFDDNGILQTGKKNIGDSLYFFNDDGSSKSGWVADETGTFYYCNYDGSIVKETWIDFNNNITTNVENGVYYLDEKGKMAVGLSSYKDRLYYFDSSGIRLRGIRIGGIYFNSDQSVNEKLAIKATDPVICHFHISSDGKFNSDNITYVFTFPNGQTSREVHNFDCDRAYYVGWEDGLYDNIQTAPTGKLTIKFYDSHNSLIGEKSVQITK